MLLTTDEAFRSDPDGAYAEGWALSFYLSETQPKTVTVLPTNNATLVTSLPTDIKLQKGGLRATLRPASWNVIRLQATE